jgi:MFS family permease
MADDDAKLSRGDRRVVWLLGLPTVALALAITVVSTYLPPVASRLTSSTLVIGLLVGGEGLMALWVPIVAGAWSDRLRTRIGGRLPFLLGATPVVVVALVVLGLAHSLGLIALAVAIFFFGYFVAYEPYRALYPDAVPDAAASRAQSTQAISRGAGTGIALIAGGLLLTVGQAAPFIAAAVLLAVAMVTFTVALLRHGKPDEGGAQARGLREAVRSIAGMVREDHTLRLFLVANALWELTLAALKTFVVLYLTAGLHKSQTLATAIIGAFAVVALGGAVLSGKLGDKHGPGRVLSFALPVYGLGFIAPMLTGSLAILPIVFAVAIGGGMVMTLPYALLQQMMPDDADHGAMTGLYSMSRGVGIVAGPLLAALAVTELKGVFSSTHGYAAVWGVCAISTLASYPIIRRVVARRRRERRREERDDAPRSTRGGRAAEATG